MAASRLGIKIPKNVFSAGNTAYAEGGDFNNIDLEPGKYTCILLKGKAIEIKGVPKIVFDLEVAGDSEQAGGKCSIFFSLEEERVVYLNRMLAAIGYEHATDLDEDKLADFLDELEAEPKVVSVSAKKAGDYVNIFVNKLLDMTVEEARGGAEGSDTENAAAAEAAGGKAGLKSGKGKVKPAEEEVEEVEETAAEAGDDLDEMDRNALKKLNVTQSLAVKVTTKMTDDELRAAIRAARDARGTVEETEETEEVEEEAEDDGDVIKVGTKCNVKVKGKLTPCTVTKVDEASGKVTVKTAKETLTVSAALLSA